MPETDLERYIRAASAPFENILEVCEEEGDQLGPVGKWVPAWSKLLNPRLCPGKYLPFLAMFIGTSIPITATESEARTLIMEHSNLNRGTLASVEAAIRAVNGTESFTIEERTALNGEEEAYHVNILIPPGKGSTALKEAIEKVMPGGVFFSIIEIENAFIAGAKEWVEVAGTVTWENAKEGEY